MAFKRIFAILLGMIMTVEAVPAVVFAKEMDFAANRAMVDFPAPAGPSIAIAVDIVFLLMIIVGAIISRRLYPIKRSLYPSQRKFLLNDRWNMRSEG